MCRLFGSRPRGANMPGSEAPTKAPAARENPARVGVTGRRTKALQGARRQHGRRPRGKIRPMLAWSDEGQRRCRERGANKGAGRAGKSDPCWRGRTKDKGTAGSEAPTRAPARRKNLTYVGVTGRRTKALQGVRRQQGRRPPGKIRSMLAWPDEGQRRCRERGANMGAGRATLIHAAFGKAEEIDDEKRKRWRSSSILSLWEG